MSNLRELYRKNIFDGKTCIQFLKDCELLPNKKLYTKLNSVVKKVVVKLMKLLLVEDITQSQISIIFVQTLSVSLNIEKK
jgi:hypothetical protein